MPESTDDALNGVPQSIEASPIVGIAASAGGLEAFTQHAALPDVIAQPHLHWPHSCQTAGDFGRAAEGDRALHSAGKRPAALHPT